MGDRALGMIFALNAVIVVVVVAVVLLRKSIAQPAALLDRPMSGAMADATSRKPRCGWRSDGSGPRDSDPDEMGTRRLVTAKSESRRRWAAAFRSRRRSLGVKGRDHLSLQRAARVLVQAIIPRNKPARISLSLSLKWESLLCR